MPVRLLQRFLSVLAHDIFSSQDTNFVQRKVAGDREIKMWKAVAEGLSSLMGVESIVELEQGRLLVVSRNGAGILTSTGDWTALNGVRGSHCSARHVVGYAGGWHSKDGWRTFEHTEKPKQQWGGVASFGDRDWALRGRSLLRWSNSKWRPVRGIGIRARINAVIEAHGRTVLCAGQGLGAYSNDGGQCWQLSLRLVGASIHWMCPVSDGFLGMGSLPSGGAAVFHSPDGASWTERGWCPRIPASGSGYGRVGDDILVLAASRVLRSFDGGERWHPEPSLCSLGSGDYVTGLTEGHDGLWATSTGQLWHL